MGQLVVPKFAFLKATANHFGDPPPVSQELRFLKRQSTVSGLPQLRRSVGAIGALVGLPHTYGALTVGQVGVEVEVEDAQLPQVGFLLQQEAHEVAAQEAAAARHNEHQTRDGGRRLWGTNVGH